MMEAGNSRDPIASSTSSGKAKFRHFDDVVALGELLVAELSIDEHADTLCRWMAHYVAQLIMEVANSSDEERAEASKKCFEEILRLWEHRASFPPGHRPLESFEGIYKLLEQIDPLSNKPYYFRLPEYDESNESEDTIKWISQAKALDRASRNLVRYCIVHAAKRASSKEYEWVNMALKPSFSSDYQSKVIAELCGLMKNEGDFSGRDANVELGRMCDELDEIVRFVRRTID